MVHLDSSTVASNATTIANPIGSRDRSRTEWLPREVSSSSPSSSREHIFSTFGPILFPRDILLPPKTNISNTLCTQKFLIKLTNRCSLGGCSPGNKDQDMNY